MLPSYKELNKYKLNTYYSRSHNKQGKRIKKLNLLRRDFSTLTLLTF